MCLNQIKELLLLFALTISVLTLTASATNDDYGEELIIANTTAAIPMIDDDDEELFPGFDDDDFNKVYPLVYICNDCCCASLLYSPN